MAAVINNPIHTSIHNPGGAPGGPSELTAVVGRGVVGLAVAFALVQRGRRVVVLGPADRPGSATLAAVGLSSLKGLVLAKTPLFAAKMAAHEGLVAWLREVGKAAGQDVTWSDAGVFEPFADLKAFDGIRERVFHREFTGCLRVRVRPQSALPAGVPLLGGSRGAFHYVRDLWVEPASCLGVLETALRRAGCAFHEWPVERLRPRPDEPGVVIEGVGGRLTAKDVVVAAGVFGDGILTGSGLSLSPQELVEGETARATVPDLPRTTALIRSGKANYVIHGGRAWAGSTARARPNLAACGVDPSAADSLAAGLAATAGSCAFLPPIWGVRGRYRDRAPAVGPLFFTGFPQPVWVALGFYKSGVQLAHLFAQKLAAQMDGAPPSPADAAFQTTRFTSRAGR